MAREGDVLPNNLMIVQKKVLANIARLSSVAICRTNIELAWSLSSDKYVFEFKYLVLLFDTSYLVMLSERRFRILIFIRSISVDKIIGYV
jgi:hypothetical protein